MDELLTRIIEERSFYRNDDEHVYYRNLSKNNFASLTDHKIVMIRHVFKKELADGLDPVPGPRMDQKVPVSTQIADAMYRLNTHFLNRRTTLKTSIASFVRNNYVDPLSHGIPPFMGEALCYVIELKRIPWTTMVVEDKSLSDILNPGQYDPFLFGTLVTRYLNDESLD